jgi:RIB43A
MKQVSWSTRTTLPQPFEPKNLLRCTSNRACRTYARLAQYYDQQILLKEQQAQQLRSELAQGEAAFRSETQLRETRREWDLSRPDALTIDRPPRTGDDDNRCGASSIQVHTSMLTCDGTSRNNVQSLSARARTRIFALSPSQHCAPHVPKHHVNFQCYGKELHVTNPMMTCRSLRERT